MYAQLIGVEDDILTWGCYRLVTQFGNEDGYLEVVLFSMYL